MTISEAYADMWSRYFELRGRSSRSAYWLATLVNVVLVLGFYLLGNFVAHAFLIPYILYDLAVIIPGITLAVRRLHDSGRSGWWWWIGVIPILGSLILLYFLVQPSVESNNDY